eukprot:scaffold20114_cov178-Skeletonema_marinoi.AAC.3
MFVDMTSNLCHPDFLLLLLHVTYLLSSQLVFAASGGVSSDHRTTESHSILRKQCGTCIRTHQGTKETQLPYINLLFTARGFVRCMGLHKCPSQPGLHK